ncbi:MAG: CocE/NonD family hydrolase [Coriobacteriales bacterium]|jgi:predicted acyl esterase
MEQQASQRRMKLLGRTGNPIDVPVRGALPESADRVRYPGFKQERILLKKGTVRMKGYMPLPCDIVLERDVEITLRDGTRIYTDVFRPDDDDKHPAILALSPYGKEIGGQWLDDIPGRSGVKRGQTSGLHKFEGPDPAYWCAHGYAVVNPDVRGAYRSEGVILFFGSQYGRDGADIVEWAAAQPWCNGRVGMSGNSWLAISQWFVAAEQPEHLAAIAPWEGLTDSFREVGTHGGVPTAEFVELLSDTFASTTEGGIEDSISAMAEHPTWDEYWEDKSVPLELIEVPAYIVASWTNSIHTRGTFNAWSRISSKEKWLRIHTKNEWYDYYQPEHMEDLRRFFDHYLKGEENGWEDTPRVRLSLLNPGHDDIIDRPEGEFPLERTMYRTLYLDAKTKSLSSKAPSIESQATYDSGSRKRKVVFTMKVDQHLEICGYIKLRLWVSPLDADDMDLKVTLEKRGPLGLHRHGMPGADPVATGYLRLSMRELDPTCSTEEYPVQTMVHIQKVSPGDIVPVDIAIWPFGMVFEPGEVLVLTVSAHKTDPAPKGPMASLFGRAKVSISKDDFTFDPAEKPEMVELGGNSTETAPDAKRARIPQDVNKGRHAIYTGPDHPSYLYLPLTDAKEE